MAGKVLSTRYLPVTLTATRGTTAIAPQIVNRPLGEVVWELLTVRFTPTMRGMVGLQVRYTDVPILPWNDRAAFVAGNDERYDFDIGIEVSGPITFVLYNLDVVDHTLPLLAKVSDIPTPIYSAAATIVPISA